MAKRSKTKEIEMTQDNVSQELQQVEQVAEPIAEQTASETPNVSVDVVNASATAATENTTVAESSTTVNKPAKKIVTLEDFITDGTSEQKTLVQTLFKYAEDMMPKKIITDSAGALKQYYLWKAIQGVINSSNNESFNTLWSIILAFAQRHKDGCFHEKYIYRFAYQWSWPAEELEAFQNIIHLIKTTCDPEKRKTNLKTVSLEKVLEKVFIEEGKQRVTIFYSR